MRNYNDSHYQRSEVCHCQQVQSLSTWLLNWEQYYKSVSPRAKSLPKKIRYVIWECWTSYSEQAELWFSFWMWQDNYGYLCNQLMSSKQERFRIFGVYTLYECVYGNLASCLSYDLLAKENSVIKNIWNSSVTFGLVLMNWSFCKSKSAF